MHLMTNPQSQLMLIANAFNSFSAIHRFILLTRTLLPCKLLQSLEFEKFEACALLCHFQRPGESFAGVEVISKSTEERGWRLIHSELVSCKVRAHSELFYYCHSKTMGKQWIVLLVFLASVIAIAAESPNAGTEEFSFLGIGSNDSCANVDCLQGTCVPNDNALLSLLFPYTCKCNSGWSTLAKIIPFLDIPSLPCNVPNCSLNLDCAGKSPAAAPGPSAPITSANTSSCLVSGICGNGKCEVTSTEDSLVPTFKCVCDTGYANVLNMTAGFCVNQCQINGSCQNLNLTLPGLTPPPPPPSPPAENQTGNAGTAPEPSPPLSGASSPSTSAGCRSISFHSGFYMAVALVMGWSSLSRLVSC